MISFAQKIKPETVDIAEKKTKDKNIWLVNCLDANGIPSHFYIKCKDYILKKLIKDSDKAGCNPLQYGDIISAGFGHKEKD